MESRAGGHFSAGVMAVRQGNVYVMPDREASSDTPAFNAKQQAIALASVPGCLRGVKYAVALEAATPRVTAPRQFRQQEDRLAA